MPARGWRALAFVGLAVVAVAVVGVAHLGHWPARPAAVARPAPVEASPQWVLGLASFGDLDHGAVVMGGGAPGAGDTFVTANGGRTWTARHVGLSATTFLDPEHAIAVVPSSTTRFESSADGGRTWTGRAAPVRAPLLGYLLNRSAGGPTFLDPRSGWWVGAPARPPGQPPALWHTDDGGRTWGRVSTPDLPSAQVADLAFVDLRTGALVTVPSRGTAPTLLATRDGGRTWDPVALPPFPDEGGRSSLATGDAAQLLVEDGRLVLSVDLSTTAGDEFSHWTSVSQDGGRTWPRWEREPASRALPLSAPVVDGAGRLLVVDDQTLWTSGDDGRTWQQRPLRLPPADHAIAVVLARGGSLLVITEGPPPTGMADVRLLRSDDGGGSWTELRLPARPVS